MDPITEFTLKQLRIDDAYTAILAGQLEQVKAQTYDVKYPGFKARQFLPVDTTVPPGTQMISYAQWDEYGMAKVIANYADDLPLVDVVARKYSSAVTVVGDAYQYSVNDLQVSALTGLALDQRRANVARRAIERAFDEIAAFGVPQQNMPGFVNHPNVPIVAPSVGTWGTASADQMLADLNKLVNTIVSSTRAIHTPDTLILPQKSFQAASQKYFGAAAPNVTVLQAFLNTNPYIRNIDQWPLLDTAGVGGTARAIAYERSNEVVELAIVEEFTQLPPQARNLAFVVPCHASIGGVVVRYPLGIAYMDGL